MVLVAKKHRFDLAYSSQEFWEITKKSVKFFFFLGLYREQTEIYNMVLLKKRFERLRGKKVEVMRSVLVK